MVKALLVSVDVDKGAQILRILDEAGLQVSVALWLFASEYEDWRVALAYRRFDAVRLREAYSLIHNALDAAGFALERTPTLMILQMKDPFVRELRRVFGKAKNVEGMRLGGQTIGDRFVEDAYVYRIS